MSVSGLILVIRNRNWRKSSARAARMSPIRFAFLHLPEATSRLVSDGAISAGHARALLAVKDPDSLARKIVAEGLTVRDIEVSRNARPPTPARSRASPARKKTPIRGRREIAERRPGADGEIHHEGERGELRIRYETLEQLDGLCHRLTA